MFYTADVGFSVSQYFANIIHTLIKMCLMCDANFCFKDKVALPLPFCASDLLGAKLGHSHTGIGIA